MAQQVPQRLTPSEALIMGCVWDMGEATVHDVRDSLGPVKPMAYNTVLTEMRILREKGFLASRREGRTDVYRPLVAREQMARRSLDEVRQRFFSGSAVALVSQLLASDDVSDEEVRAIRREVNDTLQASGTDEGGTP
jgi:predicted transcriptional regulator